MANDDNGNCRLTDVVVIGNGPSAISLSYLLDGWLPFYRSQKEDEATLHGDTFYREVLAENEDVPLYLQDIDELSQFVEGKSLNSMVNLYDSLSHPAAMLGLDVPGELTYKRDSATAIPHVVIGSGLQPGGAWNTFDGTMYTLSQAGWMSLPGTSYKAWRNLECDAGHHEQSRALVENLRRYYRDYVKFHKLANNMMNGYRVTCVRRCCCPSSQQVYFVTTAECLETGNIEIVCSLNVVLATGAATPNRLLIAGEDSNNVFHTLTRLREAIADGVITAEHTIAIVGSGLSAADAVLLIRRLGATVRHITNKSPEDAKSVFRQLSPSLYPEYWEVYQMMRDGELPGYKRYQARSIVRFCSRRLLIDTAGYIRILPADYVVILAGTTPDLNFASDLEFALDKNGRLMTDPITLESETTPGLFGIGPVVGDNLVRHGVAGAHAVAQTLFRRQALSSCTTPPSERSSSSSGGGAYA